MLMTESLSILIADDNHLICKLYSMTLARAGYQVATAADGRETLEQIAQRQPDLLVLDYMMPHMNGIEVLNQLVRNPQTAAIPVLVTSAAVTEIALACEPITRQMAVGMLPKPVGMKDLLAHVEHLLSRAQAPSIIPPQPRLMPRLEL